nr:MAG: 3'-5' exonuclease [Candidatus Methanoperedens sp.]
MTYLIFDTETTGLPKNWKAPVSDLNNWPRLVQIAWMQCDNSGKILSSSDHIVKPQNFIIPEDAVKIHGITTQMAKNEGVALNIVLKDFSTAISQSSILIAHNMAFDEKVVGAEYLREKIDSKLFTIPKICTMEESTDYCKISNPYGYKWPSLSELYFKLFKTEIEGVHDAATDVRACADCFFSLKKKGVIK